MTENNEEHCYNKFPKLQRDLQTANERRGQLNLHFEFGDRDRRYRLRLRLRGDLGRHRRQRPFGREFDCARDRRRTHSMRSRSEQGMRPVSQCIVLSV